VAQSTARPIAACHEVAFEAAGDIRDIGGVLLNKCFGKLRITTEESNQADHEEK
jgi:hypothetical protein